MAFSASEAPQISSTTFLASSNLPTCMMEYTDREKGLDELNETLS
jgi:hypothetical protein